MDDDGGTGFARMAPFVRKMWDIMQSPDTDAFITWSEGGTCVDIIDPDGLSMNVLPRFFKHNQLASFTRQMNMYGFTKTHPRDPSNLEFHNPYFQEGRPDLLAHVKRRTNVQAQAAAGGAGDGHHGAVGAFLPGPPLGSPGDGWSGAHGHHFAVGGGPAGATGLYSGRKHPREAAGGSAGGGAGGGFAEYGGYGAGHGGRHHPGIGPGTGAGAGTAVGVGHGPSASKRPRAASTTSSVGTSTAGTRPGSVSDESASGGGGAVLTLGGPESPLPGDEGALAPPASAAAAALEAALAAASSAPGGGRVSHRYPAGQADRGHLVVGAGRGATGNYGTGGGGGGGSMVNGANGSPEADLDALAAAGAIFAGAAPQPPADASSSAAAGGVGAGGGRGFERQRAAPRGGEQGLDGGLSFVPRPGGGMGYTGRISGPVLATAIGAASGPQSGSGSDDSVLGEGAAHAASLLPHIRAGRLGRVGQLAAAARASGAGDVDILASLMPFSSPSASNVSSSSSDNNHNGGGSGGTITPLPIAPAAPAAEAAVAAVLARGVSNGNGGTGDNGGGSSAGAGGGASATAASGAGAGVLGSARAGGAAGVVIGSAGPTAVVRLQPFNAFSPDFRVGSLGSITAAAGGRRERGGVGAAEADAEAGAAGTAVAGVLGAPWRSPMAALPGPAAGIGGAGSGGLSARKALPRALAQAGGGAAGIRLSSTRPSAVPVGGAQPSLLARDGPYLGQNVFAQRQSARQPQEPSSHAANVVMDSESGPLDNGPMALSLQDALIGALPGPTNGAPPGPRPSSLSSSASGGSASSSRPSSTASTSAAAAGAAGDGGDADPFGGLPGGFGSGSRGSSRPGDSSTSMGMSLAGTFRSPLGMPLVVPPAEDAASPGTSNDAGASDCPHDAESGEGGAPSEQAGGLSDDQALNPDGRGTSPGDADTSTALALAPYRQPDGGSERRLLQHSQQLGQHQLSRAGEYNADGDGDDRLAMRADERLTQLEHVVAAQQTALHWLVGQMRSLQAQVRRSEQTTERVLSNLYDALQATGFRLSVGSDALGGKTLRLKQSAAPSGDGRSAGAGAGARSELQPLASALQGAAPGSAVSSAGAVSSVDSASGGPFQQRAAGISYSQFRELLMESSLWPTLQGATQPHPALASSLFAPSDAVDSSHGGIGSVERGVESGAVGSQREGISSSSLPPMMRFPSFEEVPPTGDAAALGYGPTATSSGTAQASGFAAAMHSDSLASAVTQNARQVAMEPLAGPSQQPQEGDYPSPSEMLLEIPLDFPASAGATLASAGGIGGSGAPSARVTQPRGIDDSTPAGSRDAALAYDTKASAASLEVARALKINNGATRSGADVSSNGGPGSAATLSLPDGANTGGIDAYTNGSGAFELL